MDPEYPPANGTNSFILGQISQYFQKVRLQLCAGLDKADPQQAESFPWAVQIDEEHCWKDPWAIRGLFPWEVPKAPFFYVRLCNKKEVETQRAMIKHLNSPINQISVLNLTIMFIREHLWTFLSSFQINK